MFNLLRDSTNIAQSTGGTTANQTLGVYYTDLGADTVGISYLDSPSTTSAVTYKIQARTTNSQGAATVGRYGVGGAYPSVSSITVLEVAG